MSTENTVRVEKGYSHLEEIPDWPDFNITADQISGRIPVSKISSWTELPRILEEGFLKKHEGKLIYRGQRRYDWSLTPTLARISDNEIVREEIAERLLTQFKLSVRGRISDYSLIEKGEDLELWAVGQHHGLKTPLIDWTYSPYVALFFAFNEPDNMEEKDNEYRCIYALNKEFIESTESGSTVQIYEPKKDGHGRLVNQAGVFTISDYGTSLEVDILDAVEKNLTLDLSEEELAEEVAQYLCKIYIPNTKRDECLKFLRKMNVHHASLFPDLIGASEYSNKLIEEYVTNLEDGIESEEIKRDAESDKRKPVMTTEDGESVSESIVDSSISEGLLKIIKNNQSDISESDADLIVQHIEEKVVKDLRTDWFKRDALLANMRNKIRAVFRSEKVYLSPSDPLVQSIVDFLKTKDELKEVR